MLSKINGYIQHYMPAQDQMEMLLQKFEHILKSETYKASRTKKMLKHIPDEVSEANLRIHSKVRKVKPGSLDKINNELEKEYEKMIGEIDNLRCPPQEKEEKLKDFFDTTNALIKETVKGIVKKSIVSRANTEKMDEDINEWGRSTGFDGFRATSTNTEKSGVGHALEQRFHERQLGIEDDSDIQSVKTGDLVKSTFESEPSVDELEKSQLYQITGWSIVGVKTAKRVKYHLAAAIYYLINFELPKLKKAEKLREPPKEAEALYDQMWEDLCRGFRENYFGFEEVLQPKSHILGDTAIEEDYRKLKEADEQL